MLGFELLRIQIFCYSSPHPHFHLRPQVFDNPRRKLTASILGYRPPSGRSKRMRLSIQVQTAYEFDEKLDESDEVDGVYMDFEAFVEVPNLNVWYGPDTYMGANIMELFRQMSVMTDEEIASVHPKHNRNSIKSLIPRLRYFQDGTCIVHYLFGHEVVSKINEMYCDAFINYNCPL